MSNTERHDCPRCNGKGIIEFHRSVLGGVCFLCNGKGWRPGKPAAPTLPFPVYIDGCLTFWIHTTTRERAQAKADTHAARNARLLSGKAVTVGDPEEWKRIAERQVEA